MNDGVVCAAPPLVSSALADLSQAMRCCEKGKKTITPFPFPYEQTIKFLLIVHWMLLPFVVSGWTTRPSLAFVFCFIILVANWSLYQIAAELEQPFGDDANDIDTTKAACRLNAGLM